MPLDDPFPIESFPARVKEAILLEFNGRRPTVREVANVSDTSWLQLPGIGLRTLVEIRYISGRIPGKKSLFAHLTDAELITKCDHLQKEFGNAKKEIRSLQGRIDHLHHELNAVKAELRLRTSSPVGRITSASDH